MNKLCRLCQPAHHEIAADYYNLARGVYGATRLALAVC
jgi:hypothetical protein